jgi:hypothetical protein
LDAKLGSSVNLGGAIFCRTLMPDGSIEDRDCGKGTACCPTPPPICPPGEACGPEDCIHEPPTPCSVFGTPCCPGLHCVPSLVSPFFTTCEAPCSSDQQCVDVLGAGARCLVDLFFCPYIGPCCVPAA